MRMAFIFFSLLIMSRVTNFLYFYFFFIDRMVKFIYKIFPIPFDHIKKIEAGRRDQKNDRKSRNSLNSTRCTAATRLMGPIYLIAIINEKKNYNCCYPTGSLVVSRLLNYNNFLFFHALNCN